VILRNARCNSKVYLSKVLIESVRHTLSVSLCNIVVTKREGRIPTRCNNINDLLSIPDVDY